MSSSTSRAMNWIVRHVFAGILLAFVLARYARAEPTAAALPVRAAPLPLGMPPEIPIISVEGSCPSLPMLTAAIAALIPHGGVDLLPRSGKVEVADLANSYRVGVVARGIPRARIFQDDTRDCELRARFTAVFVVVTLLPPGTLLDMQPKALAAPPPAPARLTPAPTAVAESARRKFWLELGAIVDVAPAVFETPRMVGPGGELRVVRRFGHVAGVFAVALEPRVEFTIAGLSGRQTRFPLDLGVRLERRFGVFAFGGELGVAAAIFHADGLNTAMPQTGTRLDLGGRAGVLLRCDRWSPRAAPFVALHALLFPWPYEIAVSPSGTLGSTPALWLGATLGIATTL